MALWRNEMTIVLSAFLALPAQRPGIALDWAL